MAKLVTEVSKTNDTLDQPTFDRVTYINTLFPDVLSLMSLDPAVAKLKGKVLHLDEEIVKEVRNQSIVGEQAKKDLEDAKKSVNVSFHFSLLLYNPRFINSFSTRNCLGKLKISKRKQRSPNKW